MKIVVYVILGGGKEQNCVLLDVLTIAKSILRRKFAVFTLACVYR